MNCDAATERLPWLLNGSLQPEEAEEVQRHLEVCANCQQERAEVRQALQLFSAHVASPVLTRLALGEPLDAQLHQTARQHLEICPDCREQLELAKASAAGLAGEQDAPPTSGGGSGLKGATLGWGVAAAATLLLAVTASSWMNVRQRLVDMEGGAAGGPSVGVVVEDITPRQQQLRSAADEDDDLAQRHIVDVSAPTVLLLSLAESGAAMNPGTEVEIRLIDLTGEVIWSGSGRVSSLRDLTMSLPAGWLEPGDYSLELLPPALPQQPTRKRVSLVYELRAERPSPTSTNDAQ